MSSSSDLTRGEALRERYLADGVVHLPGAFAPRWLETLGAGIARDMAAPSARFEARTAPGSTARYCEDFWVWSEIPELEAFVRESPAAAIAAGLMKAERVNLVMDNWFLREPGATARAPWHHDVAYFDFEGTMCVLWLPLEAVAAGEGVSFVRGSHRWGRLFQRVTFRDHRAAGEPGTVNGLVYEPPPDVEADPDAYDIVAFDCAPGDAIVFDMRTLHGSRPGAPPAELQRRFTLRMAAEDGRIRRRGDWAKAERAIVEAAGYREGDAIDGDFFPRLWPRPPAAA